MKRKPKTWQSVKIYLLAGQLISTSRIFCCQEFKLRFCLRFHQSCFDTGQPDHFNIFGHKFIYLCITLEKFWSRVPLIARSWDPGSEEVQTQGGNGRKWESERGRERERERERVLKNAAFVCKMI